MAFAETLRTFPAAITGQGDGQGLTIAILKALNHLSFLRAAEDPTDDFIQGEIESIAAHLAPASLLDPPAASATFNNQLANLRQLGTELSAEWRAWPDEERNNNLADFTARILSICAAIDYELAGFDQNQVTTGTSL
jgi:hypothetical protein